MSPINIRSYTSKVSSTQLLKFELKKENLYGPSKLHKEKPMRSQSYPKNYRQRENVESRRNRLLCEERNTWLPNTKWLVLVGISLESIIVREILHIACVALGGACVVKNSNFRQKVFQKTWKSVSLHLPYSCNYCNSTSTSGEIRSQKSIPNPAWISDPQVCEIIHLVNWMYCVLHIFSCSNVT